MATYGRTLRRGLPRSAGGDGWPPAGVVADGALPETDAAAGVAASAAGVGAGVGVADAGVGAGQSQEHRASASDRAEATAEATAEPSAAQVSAAQVSAVQVSAAQVSAAPVALRQGLPRTPGGEAWPPAGTLTAIGTAAAAGVARDATAAAAGAVAAPAVSGAHVPPAAERGAAADGAQAPAEQLGQPVQSHEIAPAGTALRQGLPRTPDGAPWPPEGTVVVAAAAAAPALAASTSVTGGAEAPAEPVDATAAAAVTSTTATLVREPLPFPRTVWPGSNAAPRKEPAVEPRRFGPFTAAQWVGSAVVGGIVAIFVALMAVTGVRVLLSLEPMGAFLAAFPGEYHLPDSAPVGIPGWIGWQHFFNMFLMLLIIRTGLTVRTEKRPAVFWTSKRNKKSKTSLTIWFHQALDILWLVNGIVFVVLLFVTGQWMRIIPTSWEVFPNALSAGLQYVSLDWPTENGWVNYNSLQQLAYFTTVFIAAPLSALTGYRMSSIWPKNNAKLSAAWPIDWARKVHFPVMLYFVVFIAIHVFLVFATGALRNLNHMFAAQGSVDPTAYADNWTGFWLFVASLVVMAAAWVAARPLTIAPIARLFGTVTAR